MFYRLISLYNLYRIWLYRDVIMTLKDDLYCTTTLNINESQASMTEEEI